MHCWQVLMSKKPFIGPDGAVAFFVGATFIYLLLSFAGTVITMRDHYMETDQWDKLEAAMIYIVNVGSGFLYGVCASIVASFIYNKLMKD